METAGLSRHPQRLHGRFLPLDNVVALEEDFGISVKPHVPGLGYGYGYTLDRSYLVLRRPDAEKPFVQQGHSMAVNP